MVSSNGGLNQMRAGVRNDPLLLAVYFNKI